jgi:hypothetical protein
MDMNDKLNEKYKACPRCHSIGGAITTAGYNAMSPDQLVCRGEAGYESASPKCEVFVCKACGKRSKIN